jgi:hypothetical protein
MFVKRKKNINRFDLQECRDFTWRVSDCEELSGGYSQEMMGLVLVNYLVKYLVNLIIGSPALI